VIEAYQSQATALTRSRTQPRLSPKELAIITSIMQGKRNKEIAGLLGTSEQTVKNYLRKVYGKLGVSDRLELALYCEHHQLHKKGNQHNCPEVSVKNTPAPPGADRWQSRPQVSPDPESWLGHGKGKTFGAGDVS
jgi:DNA-binding CsgD family transcriptional regulator